MDHDEIAAICRKVLVSRYKGILEEDIPMDPWDKVITEFAGRADTQELAPDMVARRFGWRVDNMVETQQVHIGRPSSGERQRHYDHFMRLYYLGQLDAEDQQQYHFARRREEISEVKPFSRWTITRLTLARLFHKS